MGGAPGPSCDRCMAHAEPEAAGEDQSHGASHPGGPDPPLLVQEGAKHDDLLAFTAVLCKAAASSGLGAASATKQCRRARCHRDLGTTGRHAEGT